MGPLPTGESLLVVVDYYSRYYEVVVMRSTTTPKIITALEEIFARFGYPYSLKADNGPQWRGRKTKQVPLEDPQGSRGGREEVDGRTAKVPHGIPVNTSSVNRRYPCFSDVQ